MSHKNTEASFHEKRRCLTCYPEKESRAVRIIFILRQGAGTITWGVPEMQRPSFSFVGCARGIRCDGFFQAEDIHIRYKEIGAMIFDRDGQRPETVLLQ